MGGWSSPVVRQGVAALADDAGGACVWRLLYLYLVSLPFVLLLVILPTHTAVS